MVYVSVKAWVNQIRYPSSDECIRKISEYKTRDNQQNQSNFLKIPITLAEISQHNSDKRLEVRHQRCGTSSSAARTTRTPHRRAVSFQDLAATLLNQFAAKLPGRIPDPDLSLIQLWLLWSFGD